MSQQHTPEQQGRVPFSNKGITQSCPLSYGHDLQYVNCMQCSYHIQSMEFTVICRKAIEQNEIRGKA